MKYVTFFTEGYYEGVYKTYLKPSADALGIEVRAYREHNYRDWGMNTRLKAKVLLRALNEYNEVVWLDSDATLKSKPTLLEEIPDEYDLAVYYLDWSRHWEGKHGMGRMELVNAVMMLRNRPNVISLLDDWVENNYKTSIWEQQVFQNLLEARNDIKVFKLPDEYCTIIDRSGGIPEYVKEPVIVQNQISRKVRQDRTLLQ